jgi:hypothetical protein
MTERACEIVRLAELERPDGWSPIRRHVRVRAFGVNAWTAHEANGVVIPDHHEQPSGHEELYLVHRRARDLHDPGRVGPRAGGDDRLRR